MIEDYKQCTNDLTNMNQIILKEDHSSLFDPDTIINQEYSDSIIQIRLEHFDKACEMLIKTESINKLAPNIKELTKFSNDTELEQFSSIFLEREMTAFFISLLQSEFNSNPVLIREVINAIFNFSYYSTIIMFNFMESQILTILIENFDLFKGDVKSIAIKAISNFISDYRIIEFGMYFEKMIQICKREIFELDDCYYEAMHLLEMLANRDDVINGMEERQDLYEIFYQVFNYEKVWLYNDALIGIYYFAQKPSGRTIIFNDEKEKVKNALKSSLNVGSEKIQYNSLLVLNCLYTILEGDHLLNLHREISLQKVSAFLTADNDDTQKAALNVFKTIVKNHPQLIQSLIFFGFYESYRGGLLWIFENYSFDLKRSASYIVMETVKCGNENIIDYLIEKELIIYATETLTSDLNFLSDDPSPKSPLIIDSLLYLLSLQPFRQRLIAQLIDRDIYEMICNFEITSEEIDQKFNVLRGIIEEEMNK